MEDKSILKQIKDEYELGYEYMQPLRDLYRTRIQKYNPKIKKPGKITINLISNTIDAMIASFWSTGVKVKFISRQGWIGQEEADNLESVANFDNQELSIQQINYQVEQDSLFFGAGIVNRTGFDNNKIENTWRCINPLSCIPDPLPTQTGQFDIQNYRFIGFVARSNVYDMKTKYGVDIMNTYFKSQYDEEEQLTRDAYTASNGTGVLTCDNLDKNFSIDIYNHYTIVDGYKYKFVTDAKCSHIFYREKLEPVLKEEKLNPLLVPRPIMINYIEPRRNSFLGTSVCDKIEDKQTGISTLMNLNMIKARKEALGGDFLVNSRLIKNSKMLENKTIDTRYLFVDGDALGNNNISNAMYELPQSQIKTDTFNMINSLKNEANIDTKVDQLQMGLVPDKTMTKAEAQQIQAAANNIISLKNGIKSRYYKEFYHQRWRGYLENMKQSQKKFILLSDNFERKGSHLKKDKFVSKQIPHIMVGSLEDVMAFSEKQKAYLNMLYPQIQADPEVHPTVKNIFKRLTNKINGIQNNINNIIVPYSASEEIGMDYVDMINLGYMPKGVFNNPNVDLYTVRLYIQKAEDCDIKDKISSVLRQAVIDMGLEKSVNANDNNQMANSAANIMMSQSNQDMGGDLITRQSGNEPLSNNM